MYEGWMDEVMVWLCDGFPEKETGKMVGPQSMREINKITRVTVENLIFI